MLVSAVVLDVRLELNQPPSPTSPLRPAWGSARGRSREPVLSLGLQATNPSRGPPGERQCLGVGRGAGGQAWVTPCPAESPATPPPSPCPTPPVPETCLRARSPSHPLTLLVFSFSPAPEPFSDQGRRWMLSPSRGTVFREGVQEAPEPPLPALLPQSPHPAPSALPAAVTLDPLPVALGRPGAVFQSPRGTEQSDLLWAQVEGVRPAGPRAWLWFPGRCSDSVEVHQEGGAWRAGPGDQRREAALQGGPCPPHLVWASLSTRTVHCGQLDSRRRGSRGGVPSLSLFPVKLTWFLALPLRGRTHPPPLTPRMAIWGQWGCSSPNVVVRVSH